jgi:TetR/AcrR family transcriptional regulator, transcriptional repressor for nem operon
MLVNAAFKLAPHDPGLQKALAAVLLRMEQFFRHCIAACQAGGTSHGRNLLMISLAIFTELLSARQCWLGRVLRRPLLE